MTIAAEIQADFQVLMASETCLLGFQIVTENVFNLMQEI